MLPGALPSGLVEPGSGERDIDAPFQPIDEILGNAGCSLGGAGQCAGQGADGVGGAPGVDGGEDGALEDGLRAWPRQTPPGPIVSRPDRYQSKKDLGQPICRSKPSSGLDVQRVTAAEKFRRFAGPRVARWPVAASRTERRRRSRR